MIPPTKTLIQGESSNLTCHAFGDEISFTWLKNNRVVSTSMALSLTSHVHQGYTQFRSLLMIKKAHKPQEGIYTCRITSRRQPGYTHNATAHVHIQGKYLLFTILSLVHKTKLS